MEVITFTNANDEVLTFSESADYQLISRTGLGATDIVPQTSPAYGVNGTVYRGTKLGVRYIKIRFSFQETTEGAFDDTCRDLLSKLNPLLGEGLLEYENTNGKYRINAVTFDGPVLVTPAVYGGTYEVVFLCCQPLFESDTEYSQSFGAISLIDFEIITNNGDYETPARIVFSGASTGCTIGWSSLPLPGPSTTSIETNQTLLSGEQLVINTDEREMSVTFINSSAVETDAFNKIEADSVFFQITPGSRRYFAAADTGTPSVTMYWRERFVGVTL